MALNKSRSVRSARLLCASVTITTGFFTTAYAQSPEETVEFDLPAQSLEQALKSFSVSADKQLMFATDLAEGKVVAGLSGEMEPMQALDELLDGTGLVYETTSSDVILVKVADADEGGDSEQKNLSPAPVLMAQNTSQTATSTETSRRSSEGGTSIVTGKVTDARTGANLKGAKITIEETGQWTATNDLGEFRFVNVPSGSATLTVSYLGYAGQSVAIGVRGNAVSQSFALRGGSEIEEIVVFGQRSARAQALNLERTAENSSAVVSADFLGSFTGTTISDALRNVSGVTFQQNAIGEGSNIVIRGLEPDLNAVKLNGLHVPVGNGLDRSASLNNLLADSIDTITIHKSLLPRHDSAGTGGLVEIESKSPLDRPERYASVFVERGQRSKDFNDDLLASGTFAGTFGAERNFGLSASIQYRERENAFVAFSQELNFGQYLPLQDDGSLVLIPQQVDPRTPFPFEPNAADVYPFAIGDQLEEIDSSTLAITLSGELKIEDHTELRLDILRSEEDSEQFERTVNFTTFSGYQELPIQALGGQTRQALALEGFFGPGTAFATADQEYRLSRNQSEDTTVASIRGESNTKHVSYKYSLGVAKGSRSRPSSTLLGFFGSFANLLEAGLLLPEAVDAEESRVISAFSPLTPDQTTYTLPLLTDAGWDLVNNDDGTVFAGGSESIRQGSNDRYTGTLNATYEFESGPIKYIEGGLYVERADFTNLVSQTSIDSNFPTLSTLGLSLDTSDLSDIGVPPPTLNRIPQTAIRAFVDNLSNNDLVTLAPVPLHPQQSDELTTEDSTAVYFQTRVDIGRLEIIGGFRINRVDVKSAQLTSPRLFDASFVEDIQFASEFTRLIEEASSSTDFLPRVLFNFRSGNNLIYRGGYYLSVARPNITQLSSEQTVLLLLPNVFGPNGNQPELRIFEGNPELKPAKTHNIDLAIEYYHDDLGVLKASAFYKRIDDFLQNNENQGFEVLDGVILPDHPAFNDLPNNLFVNGVRPENSERSASIWGVDLQYERQLTFLPGVWAGFGIFANYAYAESSKHETVNWFDQSFESIEANFSSIPFDQAPQHSGTIAVTYNHYNFDAALSYNYQSDRQLLFAGNGLSQYQDKVDALNLRVEYLFDVGLGTGRIFLEGVDLLKGTEDPELVRFVGGSSGVPDYNVGQSYLGGRVLRAGVGLTF